MNFATFCAQVTEAPQEAYNGPTSSVVKCQVTLPPVSEKKAPTILEYTVYGRAAKERLLGVKVNDLLYIHGCQLRHDLEQRTHSINGGNIAVVTSSFPIYNDVLLSGRCIKDMNDERSFRTTDSGLMIAEQSLSVGTGKGTADLFNLVAYNGSDDRYRPAELLSNFTRKGMGLTILGRLTTDKWLDKTTGEPKTRTQIVISKLTLAPKGAPSEKPIESSTTVSEDASAVSLWGGRTAEGESVSPPVGERGALEELPF